MQNRSYFSSILNVFLILGFAFNSINNVSAQITIPSLNGVVTVQQDALGIPTISGETELDVIFVQGYLHARDRFFSMDLNRRVPSGTSAELFGSSVLADDIQLRTLGLRRAAWATYAAMSVPTRAWLQAYSNGVNAFLENNPLPPEYGVLMLDQVPPWSPVDSIVVGKALAFQLSFDLDIENTILAMAYQQAGAIGGFDGAALFSQDLVRSAPSDDRVSVPGFLESIGGVALSAATVSNAETVDGQSTGSTNQSIGSIDPIAAQLAKDYQAKIADVPLLGESIDRREVNTGSNAWAVSGEFTATGNALLANDPHLSLSFPSVFTEEQLIVTGDGTTVSGVSVPGAPGIIQGCNEFLCWGTTVNPMDVTDTYQETLVLNGLGLPVATVYQGEQEPLVAVFQSFFVNDATAGVPNNVTRANVGYTEGAITFIVPRRNNGPLVQVDGSSGLSVQYTGWGPTFELEAFRNINRAGSLDEFVTALQSFDVGSQNFLYADIEGNIAYFTSAENPIRADLQNDMAPDGGIPPFLIRDGSGTLNHEWLLVQNPQPNQATPFEIMPFNEMPQSINPESGYLANANNDPIGTTLDNNALNQIRPGGGLYYLNPGYSALRQGRVDRVLQTLTDAGNVTIQDMIDLQANNQILDAELLVPMIVETLELLNVPIEGGCVAAFPFSFACSENAATILELFREWDFSTPTGLTQGFDPSDTSTPGTALLSPPSQTEINHSVAATVFAVWRGQMIENSIDTVLNSIGLGDFAPGNRLTYEALIQQLRQVDTLQGFGVSGLPLIVDPTNPSSNPLLNPAQELIFLSLATTDLLLRSEEFAPAFNQSENLMDYRWGLLHRIVFDHPFAMAPFSVPNGGGLSDVSGELPGVARAGGFDSVDAATHSARANGLNEFMFGNGPARRFVGELRPTGPVGQEVIPGGRSSVFFSPNYTDQLFLWLTNDYHELTLGNDAAEASSVQVITFSP